MKKKIFGYIVREIHRLTNDPDLRQELWLFFLEGNLPSSFNDHLSKLKNKQLKEAEMLTYIDMESYYGIKEL
jgi:hypothetical protein